MTKFVSIFQGNPGIINKSEFISSIKYNFITDRWRQVLNEADRVEEKYLFTLQQGISANQLKEMQDYNLRLVVPHKYLTSFPKEYKDNISDLSGFINLVKTRQSKMPKHFIMG